jgi:hypothetical protein
MKRGDIVVVTESDGEFFDVGDRALLLTRDTDEPSCWWADFNGFGNIEVSGNGNWCIDESSCELAFDEDPEETLP